MRDKRPYTINKVTKPDGFYRAFWVKNQVYIDDQISTLENQMQLSGIRDFYKEELIEVSQDCFDTRGFCIVVEVKDQTGYLNVLHTGIPIYEEVFETKGYKNNKPYKTRKGFKEKRIQTFILGAGTNYSYTTTIRGRNIIVAANLDKVIFVEDLFTKDFCLKNFFKQDFWSSNGTVYMTSRPENLLE